MRDLLWVKPDLCSDTEITSLKSLVWDTADYMVAGEDSDELWSVMPGVFTVHIPM